MSDIANDIEGMYVITYKVPVRSNNTGVILQKWSLTEFYREIGIQTRFYRSTMFSFYLCERLIEPLDQN